MGLRWDHVGLHIENVNRKRQGILGWPWRLKRRLPSAQRIGANSTTMAMPRDSRGSMTRRSVSPKSGRLCRGKLAWVWPGRRRGRFAAASYVGFDRDEGGGFHYHMHKCTSKTAREGAYYGSLYLPLLRSRKSVNTGIRPCVRTTYPICKTDKLSSIALRLESKCAGKSKTGTEGSVVPFQKDRDRRTLPDAVSISKVSQGNGYLPYQRRFASGV